MNYAFEKSGKLKEPSADELAQADANSSVIVLDTGTTAEGTPYWVYIAVKPSKYAEFMRLTRARQPINFVDFGAILKYGFEAYVPDDVKQEMARDHGCREDFLAVIAQEVKAAQTVHMQKTEEKRISDIVAMLQKQGKTNN